MTTTLARDWQPTAPPRSTDDSSASTLTVVVIDECRLETIETLMESIGFAAGKVTIVVTRHPAPPRVIGIGGMCEAALMWNECHTEWRAAVAATAKRVNAITDALDSEGFVAVSRADAFPTRNPFRRSSRREIDGVRRLVRDLAPDRIVIDSSHRLVSSLDRATTALLDSTSGSRRS